VVKFLLIHFHFHVWLYKSVHTVKTFYLRKMPSRTLFNDWVWTLLSMW